MYTHTVRIENILKQEVEKSFVTGAPNRFSGYGAVYEVKLHA